MYRDLRKEEKIFNQMNLGPMCKETFNFLIERMFIEHDEGKANIDFQYLLGNSELRNRFYSKKHSKLGSILFWNKYIDIVLNTNFSVDEKLILVKFLNIICFIINIHHINRDYKLGNIKRLYCEYVAILQTESMYKLDLLKINKKVKLDFNQIVNYALPLLKRCDKEAAKYFKMNGGL